MPAARHGAVVPRGQDHVGAVAGGGRFGTLFDLEACEADEDAILELFAVLRAASEDFIPNSLVPAGFTYLAQFIDHDITFDPLSRLERRNDPHALVNFRTPRFDLDSVYGSGPRDQPFLYEWTSHSAPVAKLLVDESGAGGNGDLPRSLHQRAIIGDARNDEHLIVAQLHLLFIRFHNAVVDHLRAGGTVAERDLFETAQRLVRWHYQWIVTHEFLRLLVGAKLLESVLEQQPGTGAEPRVQLDLYPPDQTPFVPVEFSGAAYRCGHSMVRLTYKMTRSEKERPVPVFPDLVGFRPLPADRVVAWNQFFAFEDEPKPQESLKIDRSIAGPLFALPEGQALPLLNLRRGIALGLPSGQAVAGVLGLPALAENDLLLTEPGLPHGVSLSPRAKALLLRSTPLWYYILCEAHASWPTGGVRLGPVGGRIVAEVLVGLLRGDAGSYLRVDPAWRPHELLPGAEDFTMADLIGFTQPRA